MTLIARNAIARNVVARNVVAGFGRRRGVVLIEVPLDRPKDQPTVSLHRLSGAHEFRFHSVTCQNCGSSISGELNDNSAIRRGKD
jgi:hypothetical protein